MAIYGNVGQTMERTISNPEVAKSAPLFEQTAHAEAATKHLSNSLDSLAARLAPILGPERPGLVGDASKPPTESPHVAWLRVHAEGLDSLASAIDYLVSRLEV